MMNAIATRLFTLNWCGFYLLLSLISLNGFASDHHVYGLLCIKYMLTALILHLCIVLFSGGKVASSVLKPVYYSYIYIYIATMSDELDEDDITSAILGECTQACLCMPSSYMAS